MLDKGKLHAMAKTGCVTYKNVNFQLTTALITRSACGFALQGPPQLKTGNGSF